jgi:hypothetical protein
MRRSVVVLENTPHVVDWISNKIIRWADPDAEIKAVDKVSEAKKELNEHSDIAYIIVDLDLCQEEGGDDFVEWLLIEEQLFSRPFIPTLILSVYSSQFPRVEEAIKKFKKSIRIVYRMDDFRIEAKRVLYQFINEALQLYTGDANAKNAKE